MSLPSTAPTVKCTLSKPLMADGTVGSIESAFLKIDQDLVWVDTGETLFKESVPAFAQASGPEDGTISFFVVPVDTEGMHNAAGFSIQNWVYTLRVNVVLAGGAKRTIDYEFQPTLADEIVDLDLVPQVDAVTIPPVTGPPVVDLSVIDGGAP